MKKFSYIIILLFLFSFKNSISQDIEELLQPKCDGKTIKYSYSVNLLEYLQNESGEEKEIYYTAEDLKSKRIGRYKETYMGNKSLDNMKVFEDGEVGFPVKYNSYKDIIEKILLIINNYDKISKNAYEESMFFSWEKIADKYLKELIN